MYKFTVITAVPPVEDDGNLASAIVYKLPPHLQVAVMIDGRVPVFTLGEILILDGAHGREVCGRGRKPSKWNVQTESFDDIDSAVRRASEVEAATV